MSTNPALALPTKHSRIGNILPNVTAGLVSGFTAIVLAVSFASLIFTGPLAAHLSGGIAITLVTTAIYALFTAAFSSLNEAIAITQDRSSLLLGVAAMSLAGVIKSDTALFATVIAVIMAATMLTGLCLLLLGTFRLGNLVRYIPYPVMGGFVAGTGWLLAQASVGTMAKFPLTIATFPMLLSSEQVALWLPGVGFALVLFLGMRVSKHILALPIMLAGGLIIFYTALAVTGTSIATAIQDGLLLGQVGGQATWQLPFSQFNHADWGAIFGQAGTIGSIMLLTAISLLLNISGLELSLKQDIDLNRELRTSGIASLVSGLAGGMIGYHALSLSVLNYRMGARGRWAGLIAGGMCLVVLLTGGAFLAYLPKALLGGLLLFLGFDFLDEWVIRGRAKMGRADYAIVLLILGIVAVWGFLVAVGVGLVLMAALFVVTYSRLNIFYRATSGSEVVSHVERNPHFRRALIKLGGQIHVLELQGFIFFGTANVLLEQIRKRLDDPEQMPLSFLILDFRRVQGFDSSAVMSLNKAKELADKQDFTLVFTNLSEEAQRELALSGLSTDERVQTFPDLDHGLEWCEDTLLARDQITSLHISSTLEQQLTDNGLGKDVINRLLPYLEQVRFEPGEYVIRQHDQATDLYFIQIGQVSIYLELDDSRRVRLQTLTMGTVVGELAFFLDLPRSASVISDGDTIAHRLSRLALEEMKAKDPELALAFNEMMLRLVSTRLITTDRELGAALNR